jgi:hypothetical protein
MSKEKVRPEVEASAAVIRFELAGRTILSAEYRPLLCTSKSGFAGFPFKRRLVMVFLSA